MGAVYPTTLKKMATAPQGVARLGAYARLLRGYPQVGIGGIDAVRLPEVLATGVGSVAVVRALVAAEDPEATAAQWMAALHSAAAATEQNEATHASLSFAPSLSRFACLTHLICFARDCRHAAGSGCSAHAQQAALREVTVNDAAAAPQADISGFGDVPLRELPISATVIDSKQLRASGARRLADLTQFDASVTDAYNSAGYWDYLTVRGFVLDNRFNYRREGLPISAETSIPLDNKERVEILRGTSGIQAGTSAPGGLVNYVVKRPTEQDLRTVRIETTSRGSVLGALDLGGRFGENREFGYRLNVASENLKPLTHNLDGNRNLFSLAADWRITRDSVLEFEVEQSRKTQPSQNGYSLLGSVLPAPVDPRINLNNQPWSQPSVFKALTGTVRFSQALNADWRWSAQIGQQRLKSDDRLAYAFGCGAEGNYDRYCSDGTFDVYDFRSDNERRTQTAGSLNLKGNVMTGSVKHELGFGLLQSRVRNRFENQAYNYAGTGNIWGTAVVPASPDATTPQTNRDERSTELSVQDAIRWNDRFTTWLGVRHTRLDRSSIGNDGSEPTGYKQGVTTPWLAASYAVQPGLLAYASWGQGVESQVVPNRSRAIQQRGPGLARAAFAPMGAGHEGRQRRVQLAACVLRHLAPDDQHRPVRTSSATCATTAARCTAASRLARNGTRGRGAWAAA
jgi:iron complex outermembrane receptor protein